MNDLNPIHGQMCGGMLTGLIMALVYLVLRG